MQGITAMKKPEYIEGPKALEKMVACVSRI
jgi:hypothetical protein